jgi:hypothetical protein
LLGSSSFQTTTFYLNYSYNMPRRLQNLWTYTPSLKIIQHLGLHEKDLIPVTMRMYAANNNGISILGATILRLSGKSKSGDALVTRQITYVTDDPYKQGRREWGGVGGVTPP